MARKRVIYQSEALFVGPTDANFQYVTGSWDTGLYNSNQATAAARHNQLLNTDNFNGITTTGVANAHVGKYYNTAFTGSFTAGALSSGILNFSKQLHRVQNANYSFDITRQDVNQFGQLAAIDRIILEQPIVSLDLSYYVSSGENEKNLGFSLSASKSALADILSGGKDVKNYYILVSPEGTDANIDTSTSLTQGKVIGIGNASLTSYSVEASVGNLPTATVNAEGLNMRFYGKSTGMAPHVNQENGAENSLYTFSIPTPNSGEGLSALRPGDIEFSITGLGVSVGDLKLQSFTISTDIGRDPIQKLGSRYAFTREITFPVTVTASIEAIVGDLLEGGQALDSLADIVCDDSKNYDISLTINRPAAECGGSTSRAIKYTLKGAKLDSQEFSSSIGDNKSVSMTFSTQIGGPTDTSRGLFIEGAA